MSVNLEMNTCATARALPRCYLGLVKLLQEHPSFWKTVLKHPFGQRVLGCGQRSIFTSRSHRTTACQLGVVKGCLWPDSALHRRALVALRCPRSPSLRHCVQISFQIDAHPAKRKGKPHQAGERCKRDVGVMSAHDSENLPRLRATDSQQ